MSTITAISMAKAVSARRARWQWVAAAGTVIALGGILVGATPLSAHVPLPSWALAALALLGLGLMGTAGLRLVSLRPGTAGPASREEERELPSDSWTSLAQAMGSVRSGNMPVLQVPEDAGETERAAFERSNEAFQFLARRQRVIRAALDELRGELNNYYRYLTKSQVGLIGANSVAERLEQFDERLAKIRSAM
ncbi:MAG: hypothetical protein R6W82_06425 [bacterium]